MRTKVIVIVVGMLFMVSGALSVQAQPMPPDMDSAGDFPGPSEPPLKNMRNLEHLRLLKLIEVLDLTDDQSTEFMIVFDSYRKNMKSLREESERVVDQLSDKLKSGTADDRELRELIVKVDQLRIDKDEAIREFHVKSEKILTAEQLGKMVVFEERFERKLLETIKGFRHGDRPNMGSKRNKL